MIDVTRYNKAHKKGLVAVVKVGHGFALVYRQFDIDTGDEKTHGEVVPFTKGELSDMLKDVDKVKTGLQNIKDLCDALNEGP